MLVVATLFNSHLLVRGQTDPASALSCWILFSSRLCSEDPSLLSFPSVCSYWRWWSAAFKAHQQYTEQIRCLLFLNNYQVAQSSHLFHHFNFSVSLLKQEHHTGTWHLLEPMSTPDIVSLLLLFYWFYIPDLRLQCCTQSSFTMLPHILLFLQV